jgi:transcriptional regulator with XRE-family HTH domain
MSNRNLRSSVRAWWKASGLLQRQVAKRFRISQGHLSLYLSGKRGLSERTAKWVARVVGHG